MRGRPEHKRLGTDSGLHRCLDDFVLVPATSKPVLVGSVLGTRPQLSTAKVARSSRLATSHSGGTFSIPLAYPPRYLAAIYQLTWFDSLCASLAPPIPALRIV
eukprot:341781-Rhodomonas_salina.1